jgi:hypothetical protein
VSLSQVDFCDLELCVWGGGGRRASSLILGRSLRHYCPNRCLGGGNQKKSLVRYMKYFSLYLHTISLSFSPAVIFDDSHSYWNPPRRYLSGACSNILCKEDVTGSLSDPESFAGSGSASIISDSDQKRIQNKIFD